MKHRFKILPLGLSLCLGLTLAGCAQIPADTTPAAQRNTPAAPPATLAAVGAGDIRLAREGWPDAAWWQAYGDEQLNALLRHALASSPTLEAAAARIASAGAALSHAQAEGGLAAGGAASMNRQRYSGTGLFPEPIGGSWFTEASVRIEARYDFDLWGKHKAQVAAAAGDEQARRAGYAQAERMLAASITQSYFRLQSGWALRSNLAQRAATMQDTAADAAQRMAGGLATADEGRMAAQELALLKKELARVEGENVREREALRALAAGLPEDGLQPRTLPAPAHTLPSQLGMELLARRPDLQAARWRVQAALGRVDAAQAAFYPDVNLTGSLGLNTISLERLLSLPSRTAFIGPAVTLPLFDSQRLNAQLAGARSERNGVIAEYNHAVLEAVRSVAQDAATVQALDGQWQQQAAASGSAQAQLKAAQARIAHGLAGRRVLLDAQLALLKQEDLERQLRLSSVLADIALIHSLGGGYQAAGPGTAVTAATLATPLASTKN